MIVRLSSRIDKLETSLELKRKVLVTVWAKLTQDDICSGTPAERGRKYCSVQRSWAMQQPSQRLLSGPKSFPNSQALMRHQNQRRA
jgi:hypothetical protein